MVIIKPPHTAPATIAEVSERIGAPEGFAGEDGRSSVLEEVVYDVVQELSSPDLLGDEVSRGFSVLKLGTSVVVSLGEVISDS